MTFPQPFQYQGSKRALAASMSRCISIGICVWLLAGCSATTPDSRTSVAQADASLSGLSPESPFYDYDRDVVHAIDQRWYDLLSAKPLMPLMTDRTGKVVVRFHLHANGMVSDMTIVSNNMGVIQGAVCEKAIKDPAPYPTWPADMVKMVGTNYCDVNFTFNYRGK